MRTMHKVAAVVFCLLTVMFCVSCAKKEAPVQAQQTVAFPTGDFSVTLPIYALVEEKKPDETLHYDGFIFDRFDKILEKKMSGDRTGVWSYQYNEDGLLQYETFTCDEGYETTEYAYDADGRIETAWIRSDFNGKDWYRYSYVYELDDQNRPTRLTVTNTRGDYTVQIFTYEYDERSNPVRETRSDYGRGGYGSPVAVYQTERVFNFNGDVVRSKTVKEGEENPVVTTCKYGCVQQRTVSSKTDDGMLSADEWACFDEAPALVRPDRCDKAIRQTDKTDRSGNPVYIYTLPEKDAEATERLHIYQAILRDHCGLKFREEKDGSMRILKDETVIAHMETGRNADNVRTLSLVLQNEN